MGSVVFEDVKLAGGAIIDGFRSFFTDKKGNGGEWRMGKVNKNAFDFTQAGEFVFSISKKSKKALTGKK